MILGEIERQQNEQTPSVWQRDLDQATHRLTAQKREKDRIWMAFRITGDEDKFRHDIAEMEKATKHFEAEITRLSQGIEKAHQLDITADSIKQVLEVVAKRINTLSFEESA